MHIFDKQCRGCGAVYNIAESASLPGDPSDFACAVCGRLLVRMDEPNARVCRLAVHPAEPRFHVQSVPQASTVLSALARAATR
jgi:hypothetical protein